MTIQDAIKSGKPFQRKGKKIVFYTIVGGTVKEHIFIGKKAGWNVYSADFSLREILATDWEVKP